MKEIKYHLVQKPQPGVAGGGNRKYYASITQRNQITLKQLSEDIADGRTLTPTDVMAVLISLSRKIPNYLLNGDIVDLGDLGKLSVNISSEGSETEKDFKSSYIRKTKVIYKPSHDILDRLNTATYTKVNGNGSRR